MKINCRHGYFLFEEQRPGEVSEFISLFGLELVAKDWYFTFADLEEAPKFSLTGLPYLSTVAIATFEGQPWEVFEANAMVYNYDLGLVLPILSTTNLVKLSNAGHFFVSSGLIMPGSLTDGGSRVKDYAAWFSLDTLKCIYSEVAYV